MKEIRIVWKIGTANGGGCWLADHEGNRGVLQFAVNDCCRRYGAGTHWIEERQA